MSLQICLQVTQYIMYTQATNVTREKIQVQVLKSPTPQKKPTKKQQHCTLYKCNVLKNIFLFIRIVLYISNVTIQTE